MAEDTIVTIFKKEKEFVSKARYARTLAQLKTLISDRWRTNWTFYEIVHFEKDGTVTKIINDEAYQYARANADQGNIDLTVRYKDSTCTCLKRARTYLPPVIIIVLIIWSFMAFYMLYEQGNTIKQLQQDIESNRENQSNGPNVERLLLKMQEQLELSIIAKIEAVNLDMKAEFHAVNTTMEAGFDAVNSDIKAGFHAVNSNMGAGFDAFNSDMEAGFHAVNSTMEDIINNQLSNPDVERLLQNMQDKLELSIQAIIVTANSATADHFDTALAAHYERVKDLINTSEDTNYEDVDTDDSDTDPEDRYLQLTPLNNLKFNKVGNEFTEEDDGYSVTASNLDWTTGALADQELVSCCKYFWTFRIVVYRRNMQYGVAKSTMDLDYNTSNSGKSWLRHLSDLNYY